ncbi:MAG: hypothetical protein U9R08_03735, partial [Nanoarchaeota archaeon]|nr:hypothetical protein [Nanoarchaeota archaeon]
DKYQDTETINPMQKYAMKTVLYVYNGLGGSLPDCLQNANFGDIDIKRKECISNEDCTLSDTRCINNRCGQCFTDNDCVEWGWHYTDKNGNKIDLLYCMNNECVECKSDSNCGNKEACYNRRCIEAECKTDADCSGDEPFCDTSIGWYYNCVECLKDSDCLSDENCKKYGWCTCSSLGSCFK